MKHHRELDPGGVAVVGVISSKGAVEVVNRDRPSTLAERSTAANLADSLLKTALLAVTLLPALDSSVPTHRHFSPDSH